MGRRLVTRECALRSEQRWSEPVSGPEPAKGCLASVFTQLLASACESQHTAAGGRARRSPLCWHAAKSDLKKLPTDVNTLGRGLCTFGFKEALSADHGTRRAGRQRSAPKPIGLWIISASGDQLVRTGTAPRAQYPGLFLACAAACAAPPRRPKTPRSHRHITAHHHADHRSRRRPSTRKRSRAAACRPAATAPRAPAGAGSAHGR